MTLDLVTRSIDTAHLIRPRSARVSLGQTSSSDLKKYSNTPQRTDVGYRLATLAVADESDTAVAAVTEAEVNLCGLVD